MYKKKNSSVHKISLVHTGFEEGVAPKRCDVNSVPNASISGCFHDYVCRYNNSKFTSVARAEKTFIKKCFLL